MTFDPLGRNALARPDETVLDVARRAGAPIGNSCGGVGICNRCRIRVIEGDGNLTERTRFETGEERLACQAVVLGDCTVTTTYW